MPCRSSGPRMSVSLPAGEINERLPGERRVEAGAGIQPAPVSRAKAVPGPRKYKSRLSRQPPTHPFSLSSPPSSCLVSPSDRSEDWIIVLRLSGGAAAAQWEVVDFISCHLPPSVFPVATNHPQLAITRPMIPQSPS